MFATLINCFGSIRSKIAFCKPVGHRFGVHPPKQESQKPTEVLLTLTTKLLPQLPTSLQTHESSNQLSDESPHMAIEETE